MRKKLRHLCVRVRTTAARARAIQGGVLALRVLRALRVVRHVVRVVRARQLPSPGPRVPEPHTQGRDVHRGVCA